MSLKDLIRDVHGPAEIRPSIDIFLLKKKPDFREPGWHPSSFCGICPRDYVLRKLVHFPEESRRTEPGLQRIFDLGTAIHSIYQNQYLGPMGLLWGNWECQICGKVAWGVYPEDCSQQDSHRCSWIYKEVPVVASLCVDHPEFPKIVGHSDGLIKLLNKWYVLEIKSNNSRAHNARRQVKEAHNFQGQIYGELIRQKLVPVPTGIDIPYPEGLLVLYVNKDTSEEKEFLAPLDEDLGKSLLGIPLQIEMSFVSRSLPERSPACSNMLKSPANKCPVGSYCFGSMTWEELEQHRRSHV